MFTKTSSLKILFVIDEFIKGKSTLIIYPELQKRFENSSPSWAQRHLCGTYQRMSASLTSQRQWCSKCLVHSVPPSSQRRMWAAPRCLVLPLCIEASVCHQRHPVLSLLLLVSRVSKYISGVGIPDSVSSHACVQQTFPCLPWSG